MVTLFYWARIMKYLSTLLLIPLLASAEPAPETYSREQVEAIFKAAYDDGKRSALDELGKNLAQKCESGKTMSVEINGDTVLIICKIVGRDL